MQLRRCVLSCHRRVLSVAVRLSIGRLSTAHSLARCRNIPLLPALIRTVHTSPPVAGAEKSAKPASQLLPGSDAPPITTNHSGSGSASHHAHGTDSALLTSLSADGTQARSEAERQRSETIKSEFLMNLNRFNSGGLVADLGVNYAVPTQERVFANSDTPLAHVHAYGFDYDYTLAQYNTSLKDKIYELAQRELIEKRGYPAEIADQKFDRHFAIRGLHYDKRTGFLLKLDQFGKITPETVLKGRTPVSMGTIIDLYRGLRLSDDYIKQNLRMLTDTFCLPEACLLADVTQRFMNKKLDFSPQYLYTDVREVIDHLHMDGVIHNHVAANIPKYIDKNPNVWRYLDKLKKANKMLFLLTNSPYQFVDAGMRYLLGDYVASRGLASWREVFDIVIVKAKKPYFFERSGAFRKLNVETGNLSFEPVEKFKRGEVYTEGSLNEFTRITDVTGHSVLYMGDHIFSDLVGPSSTAMWKTAAIIKEIGYETKVMATPAFSTHLNSALTIERLIRFGQRIDTSSATGDAHSKQLLEQLKARRNTHRKHLKTMFNPSFGSVFRTTSHRTNFYAELGRCADIYTSSVDNFLNYPVDYCFYTQREYFPHEKDTGSGTAAHPQLAKESSGSAGSDAGK